MAKYTTSVSLNGVTKKHGFSSAQEQDQAIAAFHEVVGGLGRCIVAASVAKAAAAGKGKHYSIIGEAHFDGHLTSRCACDLFGLSDADVQAIDAAAANALAAYSGYELP